MDPDKLDNLLDHIAAGKCILVLGPEFINIDKENAEAGMCIHDYLATIQLAGNGGANFLKEDGFFFFNNNDLNQVIRKQKMLKEVGTFYANLPTTPSYESLAQIPFKLIISLSPDNIMGRSYTRLGKKYTFFKYSKEGFKDLSGKEEDTVIYNLFGHFQESQSLIFTFDNLFNFLDKLFQANAYDNLQRQINEAGAFIFLGFSYNKWYMKLIFYLFNKMYARDQADPRYAIHNKEDMPPEQMINFFKSNFGVEFSPEKEKHFIQELYDKCKDLGILFKLPAPESDPGVAARQSNPYRLQYMSASPRNYQAINSGVEFDKIVTNLQEGVFTTTKPEYNLGISDITAVINANKPNIIFISCHGTENNELVLCGEGNKPDNLSTTELVSIFNHLKTQYDDLKCIVFATCQSELQARELSKIIPYCIGMRKAIVEEVSLAFTEGFFEGFVERYNNMEYAFNNGILKIRTRGYRDNGMDLIPVLYHEGRQVDLSL